VKVEVTNQEPQIAVACVKSTVFNLSKSEYKVTVISDCITSYDKKKFPEMLEYYKNNGSKVISLNTLINYETQ